MQVLYICSDILIYFNMLNLLYLFFIIAISHVSCQTDSDAYIGDTGSCKDMLQGFINGQLASTLGTLQMENMRTEFMRSLKDKDSEIKALKQDLESLRSDTEERNKSNSIVFTRWGRDNCPAHSQTVYSGYAGGSLYSHQGAASGYLCLPPDPQWGLYKDSEDNSRALVYGAEYQFDTLTDSRKNLHDHDVPCAVCRVEDRSTVITIPARKTCYAGWNKEYTGYLMAGNYGHKAASQFVCLDENSIGLGGSQGNTNGKLFYPAEGRCGSLPCPPYVNGRELTCVVCSI